MLVSLTLLAAAEPADDSCEASWLTELQRLVEVGKTTKLAAGGDEWGGDLGAATEQLAAALSEAVKRAKPSVVDPSSNVDHETRNQFHTFFEFRNSVLKYEMMNFKLHITTHCEVTLVQIVKY